MNTLAGQEIIQLSNNLILRDLAPLARLFDSNDVAVKKRIVPSRGEMEDYNLGTKNDPKIVKVSNTLKKEQKPKYTKLLKEFVDIFSWRYQDLKIYDQTIIHHNIPLKENEKPFKQKLRRINPKLLSLTEKEVKILVGAKITIPLIFSNWIVS